MTDLFNQQSDVVAPSEVGRPNENFVRFIAHSRRLASENEVNWDIKIDSSGLALEGQQWNLRRIANDGRPKTIILRSFSHFEPVATLMKAKGLRSDSPMGRVSAGWQDLIKAHTLDHILVRKKSLPFISQAASAWRFLATVSDSEPWLITADHVRLACELADEMENATRESHQAGAGRSVVLIALIRNFADPLHLFNACPLASLVDRHVKLRKARAKFAQVEDKLAKNLAERKSEEKLPDRRAFWELVRIVFTEKPQTLNDALRFAMVKLLIITGLRVGEVALLPHDWRRTRNFTDMEGRPAAQSGGMSEALMIRHFAEKQGTALLYQTTQFVPEMFRDEIEETLAWVSKLTEPLRETLRAQCIGGRMITEYRPTRLVDAVKMYGILTGNPIWQIPPFSSEVSDCIERYRNTLDVKELELLEEVQSRSVQLNPAISRYFSPENRAKGLILREANGEPCAGRGVRGKFLLVSDVETFIQKHVPTKVSDTAPLTLDDGTQLPPWELMFLMPKRAVGAGRGDSILDPVKTFSVGVADDVLLQAAMGTASREQQSLFYIYGKTEEDRALSLNSHALRHLQNTELFRLGVADTIISKRFNRRSVAQSYEYDHRSLAEELDQTELPDDWSQTLGESKAAVVAKMIVAGRANGPIVREFKQVQTDEGDAAALNFLLMEADGFHATPYGTCLNSFTVDPCPTHLECFNNCRHLSATNLPEHRSNLIVLRGRLQTALDHAVKKPEGTIGKANQISHAQKRLDAVEKLLTAQPGELVFPDGVDRSTPNANNSVLNDA